MSVARRFIPITLDNLAELPMACRGCVYWELDPVGEARVRSEGDPQLEKESWVSATLLEWGSCGRLLLIDGESVGYVLYAPPAYVPRAAAFPTSPVGADAVLLMTVYVDPAFAGHGLGRQLVQEVAKDMVQRGVRAIEAFGDHRKPSLAGSGHGYAGGTCVVPADFLLSVGFKTVRPHPRHPRLRLDLRSTLRWREDVELALERLLGAVQAPIHAAMPGGARRSGAPGAL